MGYRKDLSMWFMSLWGFGGALIIALTFYSAYVSPSSSVVVTVNGIGEALIEAFLFVPLFVVFPSALMLFLLAGFVRGSRQYFKDLEIGNFVRSDASLTPYQRQWLAYGKP